MAIFYRGAGVGTYWHLHDPRIAGFTPQNAGMDGSLDRLMLHIVRGTLNSPFVSLTRSFGVAMEYAMMGRAAPTPTNPAIVWEIELNDPPPPGIQVIDPVAFISQHLPGPLAEVPYQHDGRRQCLIAMIDPSQDRLLKEPRPAPPGSNPPHRPPTVSQQLQTLLFALRDAEILVLGTIPASAVKCRHEIV